VILDELQKRFDIPNDRQLSIKLGVAAPVISRLRNGKAKVSAEMMIAIHETFGLPIAEIKELSK
jgi:plasmid maintenance system antidote protein VapI